MQQYLIGIPAGADIADTGQQQYMTNLPLISCTCVTQNRPLLLIRALHCFNSQTYPHKELVVLCTPEDTATHRTVTQFAQDTGSQVRLVLRKNSPGELLGARRNAAVDHAGGDYICQWDDDDWYHPRRLSYQYGLLSASRHAACTLGRIVIMDATSGAACLSPFRPWENSLLCRKQVLQQAPFPNLARGEDTPVVETLEKKGLLLTDRVSPPLYCYIFHGENTCTRTHFQYFMDFGMQLPRSVREALLHTISMRHTPEDIARLDRLFETNIPLQDKRH